MKSFILTLAVAMISSGSLIACPSYGPVYHSSSTPVVVSTPYVSPVYPSIETTTVTVQVNLAQYSAFLAPAIAVPYVQPPIPAAALVTQTPVVPVLTAPACAPACAAPVASMPTASDCSQILAELRSMKADIAALKAGSVDASVVKQSATASSSSNKYSFLTASCAACHTEGSASKAPVLLDAAGNPKMTQAQLVKARKKVKAGKMPPPDSAQAKAATPDAMNGVLEDIDAIEEASVIVAPITAMPTTP